MKVIYIGGYTDKNDSHFEYYRNFVQKHLDTDKKVAIVTLSMEPGYFLDRIKTLYKGNPQIIDTTVQKTINWDEFDLIYIYGGNTQKLKNGLEKYRFDIEQVRGDAVIITDSASANLLSKYYIGYDTDKNYVVEKGLNPKSNIFILCHADNETKTPEKKVEFAKNTSKGLDCELILLKENEQRLFINNVNSGKKATSEIVEYLGLIQYT